VNRFNWQKRVAIAWDPTTQSDQMEAAKTAAGLVGIETLVLEVVRPKSDILVGFSVYLWTHALRHRRSQSSSRRRATRSRALSRETPDSVAGVRGLELGNVALQNAGQNSLVFQNIFVSWLRNHIGGVIPSRPTRQARPCTVPSGCLTPMMKTLAPTFRSLLSPGT
jgi:hypothetical protein